MPMFRSTLDELVQLGSSRDTTCNPVARLARSRKPNFPTSKYAQSSLESRRNLRFRMNSLPSFLRPYPSGAGTLQSPKVSDGRLNVIRN